MCAVCCNWHHWNCRVDISGEVSLGRVGGITGRIEWFRRLLWPPRTLEFQASEDHQGKGSRVQRLWLDSIECREIHEGGICLKVHSGKWDRERVVRVVNSLSSQYLGTQSRETSSFGGLDLPGTCYSNVKRKPLSTKNRYRHLFDAQNLFIHHLAPWRWKQQVASLLERISLILPIRRSTPLTYIINGKILLHI